MLATQSPKQEYLKDIDVNNLTTRVAFRNMSKANQSSALGVAGAEDLIGKGDLLCHTLKYSEPLRLQGAYNSESPFLNELSFSERITGLLALFITLFAANLIADIGMGDVKLCAALGFALGAVPEFIAVLLALISAKLYGHIKKENELPLAPFICAANAAVFLSEVFLNA